MASRRTETETWFIRRVVPHFIEPYAAGPDVWSRASTVLLVADLHAATRARVRDRQACWIQCTPPRQLCPKEPK